MSISDLFSTRQWQRRSLFDSLLACAKAYTLNSRSSPGNQSQCLRRSACTRVAAIGQA